MESKASLDAPGDVQNVSNNNIYNKGWRFWLIFIALFLSIFICGIDLGSMATALPSIIQDLHGTQSFAWVSTAYTLTTTAVLPLSGRLAEIFGRRDVLLCSLLFFAIGSAVCASAHSMTVLIAGRALQGVGCGGIRTLAQIVVADTVPLKDRGFFNAIIGIAWSMSTAAGPFIGGAIVEKTTWRWLFYINFPMTGVAFVSVLLFLKLRKPARLPMRQSLAAIDWIGNFLIIGSTTSCMIALTWAGILHPWSSFQVVVPLVLGVVGLSIALVYEFFFALHPSIPLAILSNRTSLSGYFGAFAHGIVSMSVNFYLPAYFQAAKLAPPLLSGLYIFPLAITISPSAIVQGIFISKFGYYRYVSAIGWIAALVGVGLLSILGPTTPIGVSVPFQIIGAVGFGFLYASNFSVQAPLDVSLNAPALSFLLFARSFATSWSVAIGASILQNQLRHRLPAEFLSQFPTNEDITYAAIPQIPSLSEPLRSEVQVAFGESLRILWRVLLAISAVGLLSIAAQKEIPLHRKTDEKWGMKEEMKTTPETITDIEHGGPESHAET